MSETKTIRQTGPKVAEMAEFDNVIKQFMIDRNIPGASVAVLKGPDWVHRQGYGHADRSNKHAVWPVDLFCIASVSKPITAVTILKLN